MTSDPEEFEVSSGSTHGLRGSMADFALSNHKNRYRIENPPKTLRPGNAENDGF